MNAIKKTKQNSILDLIMLTVILVSELTQHNIWKSRYILFAVINELYLQILINSKSESKKISCFFQMI